jgi:single-strand DNA-binding protein
MLNKVMIIGNLGQDPELKTINGKSVCNFSVATSEKWTDKQGQKQEKTEWHRVTVWDKIAENCAKYLAKGKKVYVEGKLQTRSWEKDGQKHYATDISANTVQFLSPAGNGPGTRDGAPDADPGPGYDGGFGSSDEIPF